MSQFIPLARMQGEAVTVTFQLSCITYTERRIILAIATGDRHITMNIECTCPFVNICQYHNREIPLSKYMLKVSVLHYIPRPVGFFQDDIFF